MSVPCPWFFTDAQVKRLQSELQKLNNKAARIGFQWLTATEKLKHRTIREFLLERDRYFAMPADKRPKRYRPPVWLWNSYKLSNQVASECKTAPLEPEPIPNHLPLLNPKTEAALSAAGRLTRPKRDTGGITYEHPPRKPAF